MGFPTKVQLINRKSKWIIADKGHLILARQSVPPDPVEDFRD